MVAEVDHRRLVVVPDGFLAYLPFGVLVHPTTGTPLLVDREVLQLPSLETLSALRAAPAHGPVANDLVVVADPVLDRTDPRFGHHAPPTSTRRASLARLKGTGTEAESLLTLNPSASTALIGFEASRDRILSGALRGHRVVHIAAHGVLDGRHPELSALVLSSFDRSGAATDGFLRLDDVYRLRLDADLVVLSACETALGQAMRGEGLIGLARGFFFAGAKQVIASLWQVRDDTTAELMRRFHERLQRGEPATAALRAAQLALRADPSTASPYFWAGFTSLGDWR